MFHTGFFLRTIPALKTLRQHMRHGQFGNVLHVHLRFTHNGWQEGWLRPYSWMFDRAQASYGGFGDLAIHLIDLARWLELGEFTPRGLWRAEAPGNQEVFGAATLSLANGAPMTVRAGWIDDHAPRKSTLELSIIGDRATARVTGGSAYITSYPHDGRAKVCHIGSVEPFAASALAVFLNAVSSENVDELVTIGDALEAQEYIERLYRCADVG